MYAIYGVTFTINKNPSHVSINLPLTWILWVIEIAIYNPLNTGSFRPLKICETVVNRAREFPVENAPTCRLLLGETAAEIEGKHQRPDQGGAPVRWRSRSLIFVL